MAIKTGGLFPFSGNVPAKSGKETPLPVVAEKNQNQSLSKEAAPGSRIPMGLSSGEAVKSWVSGMAQTLGLPRDVLSYTLLTFARLFSLTPDSELIASLRKEVLASGSSSPKTGKEKAALEAKALAVLAAADKGVILSKEALEAYAALPDQKEPPEEHKRAQEAWNLPGGQPDAEDLQKHFGNSGGNSSKDEEERQLLDFLNLIPGKNGQRWIVWPFNYSADGTELKVLLRVLIADASSSAKINSEDALCLLDIEGPKRVWRFLLNKTGEKLSADVSVFPELLPADARVMRKEMIKALGFSAFCIRNGEDLLLAEKLGAQALPSLNEEV